MPEKILLTAARSPVTLDLARQFDHNGHKVYVTDTTYLNASRFSNSVQETFVAPSPRFNPKEFVDRLIEIVKEKGITLLVPIYEEILLLARERERFPKTCTIFCPSFDMLHMLHNKWLFHRKLLELGIESPKTVLIRSLEDLKNVHFSTSYALKESYSRASLSLKKVRVGQPVPRIKIEPKNPWIAQEWIEGERYCTYSVCQDGVIKAHSVYPVRYAIDGTSCLTFQYIDHPGILKWVESFVGKIGYTGQIAFDFIETPNKKILAIECNPRATSGVHLFNEEDHIDKAFLNENRDLIIPKSREAKQLIPGMLMYGWRKSSYPGNNLLKFLQAFFSIKDVVFSTRDLKPFLAFPIVLGAIWATSRKYKISIPAAFTFDFEWNGE